MQPGSASNTDASPDKNLTKSVAGWLAVIALLWLLAPNNHYQFKTTTLVPQPAGYATERIRFGIEPASFMSLHREGAGLASEGPRHLDWQAYELSFHPHPWTLMPIALLLLSAWMTTQRARSSLVVLNGWIKRVKPRAAMLSSAVFTALVSGFVAGMILALLLPMAQETVLERADIGQLKTRLVEQLAGGEQNYHLRLEPESTAPAQLVIRRYARTFDIDTWESLIQTTELERRDLNQFRSNANPAVLPLALSVGLIVFGFALRRRWRRSAATV